MASFAAVVWFRLTDFEMSVACLVRGRGQRFLVEHGLQWWSHATKQAEIILPSEILCMVRVECRVTWYQVHKSTVSGDTGCTVIYVTVALSLQYCARWYRYTVNIWPVKHNRNKHGARHSQFVGIYDLIDFLELGNEASSETPRPLVERLTCLTDYIYCTTCTPAHHSCTQKY